MTIRILFLGPQSDLVSWLMRCGSDVEREEGPIGPDRLRTGLFDFVVSYGYRYILRPETLAVMPDRIVNLHISALPFNRGADPNLWSFVDDTPKGVTLHHIDAGIDTGDILAQRLIHLDPNEETLASSYEKLHAHALDMFRQEWPKFVSGRIERRKQPPGGSFHRSRNRALIEHLITDGWETPCRGLAGGDRPAREGEADRS